MNDSRKLQLKFANATGMLASRLSLSPIAGQIYGLLYLSEEPVSLNDMVDKLAISKASASTNVRALESWGAVRKVWVSNSRRDYYEAEPDIMKIVFSKLKEGMERRMGEFKDQFSLIDSEKKDFSIPKLENNFIFERINHLEKIFSLIEMLLNNFPYILELISSTGLPDE
ncbi:MAG: hypothetical protein GX817_00675 [Elusimicrobia bacterium]|nr:hypothetical protein [Elusimicrobiota bacterium]